MRRTSLGERGDMRKNLGDLEDMKKAHGYMLRARFVSSYARDLCNKLQRMHQGSKSVEEYFKEMKFALMRTNILESNEATMARFLHGLNREVQDAIELYHYNFLDDLVHQALDLSHKLSGV
ncbi:hypothetical protein CR513_35517, partial [Mucuna pruriens]